MKLGTNDIGSVYLGTNAVQKVYLGANEVWSSYAYLLDTYSGAAAAYSLRKLRSAYTGSAIRVRIATTGNPEYNIGFVNNELDVATLEGYCTGGLNAFVKTWYDQSGNARDATQTTAANQPQIVSSGSVILENSNAAIDFLNSNDSIGFNINYSPSISNLFVYSVHAGTQGRIFSTYASATLLNFFALFMTSSQYQSFIRNSSGSNSNLNDYTTSDVQVLHQFYYDSTNNGLKINDRTSVTASASLGTIATINGISIGKDVLNNTNSINGTIQEVIIYTSNQSSNSTGISTNINSFYSIY